MLGGELLPSSCTIRAVQSLDGAPALGATIGYDQGGIVLHHGDEACLTNLLPDKGHKTNSSRFPVI